MTVRLSDRDMETAHNARQTSGMADARAPPSGRSTDPHTRGFHAPTCVSAGFARLRHIGDMRQHPRPVTTREPASLVPRRSETGRTPPSPTRYRLFWTRRYDAGSTLMVRD